MGKKFILIFLGVIIAIGVVATVFTVRFFNETKDYENVFKKENPPLAYVDASKQNTTFLPKEETAVSHSKIMEDKDALDSEKEKLELKEKHIINLLLLGIDKTTDREEWLKVYRSDTIALASINLDTKKVNILSIPRDTYTYLPCIEKMDKINHAYAYGGMNESGIKSTVDVVNQFIKYSSIDYYFSLDMEPIPQIVDSLGGVELDVDLAIEDEGVKLQKGMQKLNGKEAFVYIHWRFSRNGDIDRIQRQQNFVKAMVNKLKEKGQFLKAVKIVLDYRDNIKTNLSTKQIIALVNLMDGISSEDIKFYGVAGKGEYINKISYWIPDKLALEQVLEKQLHME